MRDPYQVLGVPAPPRTKRGKKAYRDLARKYHPANLSRQPLADLATQERMKEINEAYGTVQSSARRPAAAVIAPVGKVRSKLWLSGRLRLPLSAGAVWPSARAI